MCYLTYGHYGQQSVLNLLIHNFVVNYYAECINILEHLALEGVRIVLGFCSFVYSFAFYDFYQILTAFNKLKIISGEYYVICEDYNLFLCI